jgi:hypothetical protein
MGLWSPRALIMHPRISSNIQHIGITSIASARPEESADFPPKLSKISTTQPPPELGEVKHLRNTPLDLSESRCSDIFLESETPPKVYRYVT